MSEVVCSGIIKHFSSARTAAKNGYSPGQLHEQACLFLADAGQGGFDRGARRLRRGRRPHQNVHTCHSVQSPGENKDFCTVHSILNMT